MRIPTLLLLALTLAFTESAEAGGSKRGTGPVDHALILLEQTGVSNELRELLVELHDPNDRDRIVALNILGFLERGDYSGHYSRHAVRRCQAFMRKYRTVLTQTEKLYGVPKETITALLWVETKLGKQLGNNNVPHVYFSLLQADHPEVIRSSMKALATRAPASTQDHKARVVERSKLRSTWALDQLIALDEIHRKGAKDLRKLQGSYAGAFGIPQFIPTSYLEWSRPAPSVRPADLFQMSDAIRSVGYYLKSNGWNPLYPESHRAALFHYNRAEGYVNVIQKLAAAL